MSALNPHFEHRFWLRILRDHMIFIGAKLHPKHQVEINTANELKAALIVALQAVEQRRQVTIQEVEVIVERVRAFKLALLDGATSNPIKVEISLPPTMINHMLNELEEYQEILGRIAKNDLAPSNILNVHNLWLSDAAGHCDAAISELDPVEGPIRKQLKQHKKEFKMLHGKTKEFVNYVRRLNHNIPAVQTLTVSAFDHIEVLNVFLKELLSLRLSAAVLGTLAPLFVNHMIREGAYYLGKMGANVGEMPLDDRV